MIEPRPLLYHECAAERKLLGKVTLLIACVLVNGWYLYLSGSLTDLTVINRIWFLILLTSAFMVSCYSLILLRLKYPMRIRQSIRFYQLRAKRLYPGDRWLRLCHLVGSTIFGGRG